MKLLVRGVVLPLSYTKEELAAAVSRKCGAPVESHRVLRRAVAARKKSDVRFVFNVEASVRGNRARLSADVLRAPAAEERPLPPYRGGSRPLRDGLLRPIV